jgi:hypothetical protein
VPTATNSLDISDLPAPDDISDLPAPIRNTTATNAPAVGNTRLPTNPISDWTSGFFNRTVTGAAAPVAGGLRGAWDLALGRGADKATEDIGNTEQTVQEFGTPDTTAGRMGAAAAESNWNPLNWPGVAVSWTGKKLGGVAESLGAPAWVSASAETAPAALVLSGGVGKGIRAVRNLKPYEVEAESTARPNNQSISAAAADGGAVPAGTGEPLGAPVEGGLPEEAHSERAATLARVGLENARASAVTGDAKSAAVDYGMTKYDQPAGRAAAAQFEAERNALANHTERLIGDQGATVGMDEDTLAARGQIQAQPFSMLRDWFSQRMRQLYSQADEQSAAGRGTSYNPATGTTALTNLESVDKLLADPSFQNTLAARNQQGLLGAVQRQLQFFRENNPNGFSAAGAEQFRQWLNQIWSPENRQAVGRFKDAIDNDVTSAAGEDIYAQARAIKQLESRTFEAPGVSDLFEIDPKTGETVLDHSQIPDRLARLPPGKLSNIMDTLRGMPEELQPSAQAAASEIKGHLLNKVLQAGTQTSRGTGAQVWGTDRVAQVVRNNAAKFRVAFRGDTEAQSGLEDLSNAGQILRVDQSYPGADAQAANAMKRGLVSRTLGHLGGSAGAAGGALIGGPLGAAAGGALGESAGLSVGQRAAEKAALKSWNKRVQPTEAAP